MFRSVTNTASHSHPSLTARLFPEMIEGALDTNPDLVRLGDLNVVLRCDYEVPTLALFPNVAMSY